MWYSIPPSIWQKRQQMCLDKNMFFCMYPQMTNHCPGVFTRLNTHRNHVYVPSVILVLVLSQTTAIVSRNEWGARPPKLVDHVHEPVPYVIIHHSYTPAACWTGDKCEAAMRSMQIFHQDDRGWNDIGYKWVSTSVSLSNGWRHTMYIIVKLSCISAIHTCPSPCM